MKIIDGSTAENSLNVAADREYVWMERKVQPLAEYYVIKNEDVIRKSDRTEIAIEDMVAKAQQGDKEAFSAIYREYVQPVYRYIYIRVNNDTEQAEDLTQEVFLKALDNIDRYRFQGKPFAGWLFRIAHNLVIDHYRKSGNTGVTDLSESPLMVSDDDPAEATEQSMEIDKLNRAIEQLPAQQKEIITLRFGNGFSVAETAEAIGKTKGTVKKLQHVALAKLKNLMKR